MLNASCPHRVKVLGRGTLPFHKAGRHRRVRRAVPIACEEQCDQARASAWKRWPGKRSRLASDTSDVAEYRGLGRRRVPPDPLAQGLAHHEFKVLAL